MITPVEVVHGTSTYASVQQLLLNLPKVSAFPVVDKPGNESMVLKCVLSIVPETMNLIGSVSRHTLNCILDDQVNLFSLNLKIRLAKRTINNKKNPKVIRFLVRRFLKLLSAVINKIQIF